MFEVQAFPTYETTKEELRMIFPSVDLVTPFSVAVMLSDCTTLTELDADSHRTSAAAKIIGLLKTLVKLPRSTGDTDTDCSNSTLAHVQANKRLVTMAQEALHCNAGAECSCGALPVHRQG